MALARRNRSAETAFFDMLVSVFLTPSRIFKSSWVPGFLILAVALIPSSATSQSPTPVDLVRRAVQNEIRTDSNAHFMFKDERTTGHTSQTKLLIETSEATAGMIIAQDSQPLSPQQQQAEDARLQNYIRNPDQLAWKRRQEKDNADRTLEIIKALPDAFLYEADGTVPGSPQVGRPGAPLVRLKFRPNPKYDPPSREQQVLTGMYGHVLVDPVANRIAEIDATLEKQVAFGWGILGHLDRGGHFLVQQAEVSNQQWGLTRMDLVFTGKILLFKTLTVQSSDVFSDFRPVSSNLNFTEGVELLYKELAAEQAAAAKSKSQMIGPPKPDQNQKSCCGH
jgi:hypothetical protein